MRRDRRAEARRCVAPAPMRMASSLTVIAGQIGDAVQERELRQVAQLLGHPEPDIGGAGDQHGIGIGEIPVGKLVGGFGPDAGGAAAGPRDISEADAGKAGGVVQPVGHRRRLGRLARRGRSAHSRCSGRGCRPARSSWSRLAVQMRDRHRHHEARGAEAALAAVMGDHRLLHRMQSARRGRTAPRRCGPRVPCSCGSNRMQAFSAFAPCGIGDHHRAGAAIALVAALLGALQPASLAQEVEQGPGRRLIRDRGRFLRSEETDFHAYPSAAFSAIRPCAPGPMRRKAGRWPVRSKARYCRG